MRRSDEVRLRHMLDAARTALRMSRERTRRDLDEDEGLAHSLVRVVQIISMRNRLVHAYYDIDLDIVWNTVQEDLFPLIERLEFILAPETE